MVDRWTPAILFPAANRPMITHRRFVRPRDGLGLVDDWASSGRRPDCADDQVLPYDFRAECRQVARQPPG